VPGSRDTKGTYRTVPRPATGLVCGDFNFEPNWPDYRRMLSPFASRAPAFLDAWSVRTPGKPHAPTAGIYDTDQWPKGPNCRDFVFITSDLAPRLRRIAVDVKTDASDHQPVLVEFD
jgi:endonuclease/exonuclease/phosphatase family metal-dependent hydrolase